MTEHLGHDKHEAVMNATGNARNGKSNKTLKGKFGELPIEIPRDRDGSFEPPLISKHQTRWTGVDDKIISRYARSMTVREIQQHLGERYGTEISPSLISSVTDAVVEEVKQWQSRPLDMVYLSIGINRQGEKEVLGLWIAQTEGAKFWLAVVTELKNRGVADIFIACVDGLKVLASSAATRLNLKVSLHRNSQARCPEAIEAVNMRLRKVTKSRGAFPNDEAVMKLFYLALMNISKQWTMPLRDWKPALNRFSTQFEERMPQQ